MRWTLCAVVAGTLAACGGGDGSGDGARAVDATPVPQVDALSSPVGPVSPETQRSGDVAEGLRVLLQEPYVSCGLPWSAYQVAAGALGGETLPDRPGRSANLPYYLTAHDRPGDVTVVAPNCFQCHAGHINGQLVLGLGEAQRDYTIPLGGAANIAGRFITEAERPEYERWKERVVALSPKIIMKTRGPNPADNVAAVLFANRDPVTLAWLDEPWYTLPEVDPVPIDVPPWWWMKKKNAMFYTAGGRGDHARIMMSASALCTDTVEEAAAIDALFPNVRSYILSLEAPAWPYAVDAERAAAGKAVFEATCSTCHGTYDADPANETFPNLVVAASEVGTDPSLIEMASQFADPLVNWFNASFYGQAGRFAPAKGFMAPPLDGIWATAPFLHNGSVPTLAGLLDSRTRPRYWTRTFDPNDYDPAAVGWVFTELDHGQAEAASASEATKIYDTTNIGYSNAGHTYGDALTTEERAALLEYLKTL